MGSSPRMRGTHARPHRWPWLPGIIPAYAGNTHAHREGRRHSRDHPRVCGEHCCLSTLSVRESGSSPRMRGTRVGIASILSDCGIIPAYAGNTVTIQVQAVIIGDHPRVCGEHTTHADGLIPVKGSSPRMRGTLGRRVVAAVRRGIIPAYAGNTNRWCRSYATRWDHPRVCGEHLKRGRMARLLTGSSPRMRGTPNKPVQSADHAGIIPAYAGNTSANYPQHRNARDHPRVCGEHYPESAICGHNRGSSPRMRGTPFRRHGEFRRTGIIPAYAGNTKSTSPTCNPTRDHPRVCGEHRHRPVSVPPRLGSSPRMRGTPPPSKQEHRPSRIIPAYAGNTCRACRFP